MWEKDISMDQKGEKNMQTKGDKWKEAGDR